MAKRSKQDKNQDFMQLALERFDEAVTAEKDFREDYIDDLKFSNLDQWPEEVKDEREKENKPILTLDQTGQHVRQVTGDIRQNKPSIKVKPHDDQTDPDTAEVIEGLIRHIEDNSKAQRAYVTAATGAVKGGYGVVTITNEWSDDDTFEQDIKINRVRNPLKWYLDPNAEGVVKEDMNWAFGTTLMSRKEFKKKYPNASESEIGANERGTNYEKWFMDDKVRVAEYYVRETTKQTLSLMSDGTTMILSDLPKESVQALAETGITKVRDREIETKKVVHYILSGKEILEGPKDIPGKYIPVVPFYGEEVDIEGRVTYKGIIRPAKDPQRMYNYHRTAAIEMLALQPKQPFIGTVAQFKNLGQYWDNVNKANIPYLPYNPDPKAPGAPQRQAPQTAQPALYQEAATARDDIQSATGIYNSSLGQDSPEKSGRAILARERQSDTGTFEYNDNAAASIEHVGVILVGMIPQVYDTPRTIRILGEDESEKVVQVNGPNGRYDITAGKYDVKVVTGPSYATKRMEAAESMLSFVQAVPQAGEVTADLIASSMDWPDADKIAARLKKVMPQDLDDIDPDDPEFEQKRQAAQQSQMQEQQAIQLEQQARRAEIAKDEAAAAKTGAEAKQILQEMTETDDKIQKMVNMAVQQALMNVMR